MVSRHDATLYFNVTLLLLFGHAFFGTFISINRLHRMNLVLVAIFLFLLCFPLGYIFACMVDSPTFDFMVIALMCIITFILGDMINLSRIVDALSASINEEVMPFSLKRIAITTAFFTGLVLFVNKLSDVIGHTIIYGIQSCLTSPILCGKLNLSRILDAHPISSFINVERRPFMFKRIAITTTFVTGVLTFIIRSSFVTVSTKIFCIYTDLDWNMVMCGAAVSRKTPNCLNSCCSDILLPEPAPNIITGSCYQREKYRKGTTFL